VTFAIAAVGFILGIFIMVLSHSLEVLLIGRTFIGWGIGIGTLFRL
jgi:predicted MFS family arabinose efflux permease